MQRGNLGAGVERSTVEQEKEVLQERAPPEPKAANLNGGSKPNRRLKSVLQEAKSAEAEPDLIAAIRKLLAADIEPNEVQRQLAKRGCTLEHIKLARAN